MEKQKMERYWQRQNRKSGISSGGMALQAVNAALASTAPPAATAPHGSWAPLPPSWTKMEGPPPLHHHLVRIDNGIHIIYHGFVLLIKGVRRK